MLREKIHECQNLERSTNAMREELYLEQGRTLNDRHIQMELSHIKVDMKRMLKLISGTKEFEAFKVSL